MADLATLKTQVCQDSVQPAFIHHNWFVDHHLAIIESIVEELLQRYPEADATVCRAMIWVHDWGKVLTNKGTDEEEVTRRQIAEVLPTYGFTPGQIAHIRQTYDEMEDLHPQGDDFLLETKIISSADALSHYVGPFFSLYWYENPQKSVEELIADDVRKVKKDLEKILLPEVLAAAQPRMQLLVNENLLTERPASYLA